MFKIFTIYSNIKTIKHTGIYVTQEVCKARNFTERSKDIIVNGMICHFQESEDSVL